VEAFTRGPAKLDSTKDGEFELFGGNICGVFVELVRKGSNVARGEKWDVLDYRSGHEV
jgi:activator of HSP90 ATPase